jgi:hypothetical protein
VFDLMIDGKCAANLPGSCLFEANENYLCHDPGLRSESASPPGGTEGSRPGHPVTPLNVALLDDEIQLICCEDLNHSVEL